MLMMVLLWEATVHGINELFKTMRPKIFFITICFLLFLTAAFLVASGSWQGEVSLSDNAVPVNCSLTATIINLQYIPSDPEIKQELDDGKATINYEYVWTFSPGGQIESGQGTPSCTGKFTTVSSAVNDKTVSVNVTAEVIYLEDSSVVDSDSHNFSANLTVFDVEIKAANGIDEPDPYIPAEGSRTYKAVVSPSGLSGSYEWSKQPSDTEVINIYPSGLDCEVRSETTLTGGATLKVRFTPEGTESYAEDSLGIEIFRPDIEVVGLGEDTEEDPGAYIAKTQTKSCSLQLEGSLPGEETVTLSCNNPGKVSLWEDETQKSFPYGCPVSALPKSLTLKGEATSTNIKDITLTLTTSNGGSDSAVATVYEIDLDWDGLSDAAEEETGLYIHLNVDDDNSDTVLDRKQSPVFGEDELKKLIIRKPSPSDLPSYVALTISSGSSKMKLWEDTSTDTEKIVEVAYRNYSISDDLQSDTWLWVEGYAVSSTKEVEVKITYQPPYGEEGEDKVKATVAIGTILLDPGHGGTDPGAIGPTGLEEKEPNLDIGLRLKDLLEGAGITVNMTRTIDEYKTLQQRADMAKNAEPKYAFFLSIHNNAADSSVRGTETYTTSISPYTIETTAANEIQGKVHSVVLENNRGVKTDDYVVLRHSLNGNTDGNLSETTFITNSISEDRLKQSDFKQSVAEAMKKAILKVLVEDITYPKQPN
jgi:N-acetylmuramoyl-L-alanine amidase